MSKFLDLIDPPDSKPDAEPAKRAAGVALGIAFGVVMVGWALSKMQDTRDWNAAKSAYLKRLAIGNVTDQEKERAIADSYLSVRGGVA